MPSYDQYRALLRSEQMAADLSAARELAEEQKLIGVEALAGQYEATAELEEVNKSLGGLREATERANELAEEQAHEQEVHREMMLDQAREQSAYLQRQAEEAAEGRRTINDIRDIGVFGLVLSGATALAAMRGAEHLEHISNSMDASEEWLENISDGVWEVNDGVWEIAREVGQANVTLERIENGQVTLGDRITNQIQISGQLIIRALSEAMYGMTDEVVASQREIAEQHEESGGRRHRELLSKLITPLANEAEEKFAQAQTLYRTHDNGLCAKELGAVFERVRTHELGWTLFGQLLVRLGQPTLAREAFARATRFALDKDNLEAYVVAMVHLSHLERVVGNYQRAYDIMVEVQTTIGRYSSLSPWVRYELLKAFWVLKKKTCSPYKMWYDLQELFEDWPELRDEVAVLPLWKDLVKVIEPLRFGNFRYIQLAEMWFSRQKLEEHGIVIIGPDWTTYLPHYTRVHEGQRNYDQTLDLALELIWKGKVDCPEEVIRHLNWLQSEVADLKYNEMVSLKLEHFIHDHEALVLFVYKRLKHLGQSDHAEAILESNHLSWNYRHHQNGRPKMIMPRVAFEQFKTYLRDEKALQQHLYELPEIFLADPRLRDDFNDDQQFMNVWMLCPWLTFRNVRYARLYEAVGSIVNELKKLDKLPSNELKKLLLDISEMLRRRDWGRGKFTDREQQLFAVIEKWLDNLYEAVQWPEFDPDPNLKRPTKEGIIRDFLSNEGGRIRFASLLKRLVCLKKDHHAATLLDDETFQDVEAEIKFLYTSGAIILVIHSVEHSSIFAEYRATRDRRNCLVAEALAQRQAQEQAQFEAERAKELEEALRQAKARQDKADETARLEAEEQARLQVEAKRQADEIARQEALIAQEAKRQAESEAEVERQRKAELQKVVSMRLITAILIGLLIIVISVIVVIVLVMLVVK